MATLQLFVEPHSLSHHFHPKYFNLCPRIAQPATFILSTLISVLTHTHAAKSTTFILILWSASSHARTAAKNDTWFACTSNRGHKKTSRVQCCLQPANLTGLPSGCWVQCRLMRSGSILGGDERYRSQLALLPRFPAPPCCTGLCYRISISFINSRFSHTSYCWHSSAICVFALSSLLW